MNGIWVLLRKEVLEQRRSKKFIALLAVFMLVAILPNTIFLIVTEVQDEIRDAEDAREGLSIFLGLIGFFLGPLLCMMLMMGSVAAERDSGTAAMTLHKPVTRLSFISAKLVAFAVMILLVIFFTGVVDYIYLLIIAGDGGVTRFAGAAGILTVYLVFLGTMTCFWSSLLRSPLGAGGLAVGTWVVLHILLAIPRTERYMPISIPDWATDLISGTEATPSRWPAFLIVVGCIAVLSVGAWAVFRRKEL